MVPKLRLKRRNGVITEFTPSFPPRTQLLEDEALNAVEADDLQPVEPQEPEAIAPIEVDEPDTAEGDDPVADEVPVDVGVEDIDQAAEAGVGGAVPEAPEVIVGDDQDGNVEEGAAAGHHVPPIIVLSDDEDDEGSADDEYERHPGDPDSADPETRAADMARFIQEFRAFEESRRHPPSHAEGHQWERELDQIDAQLNQERTHDVIQPTEQARAAEEIGSRQQPARAEHAAARVYPPQRRRQHPPAEEDSDDGIQFIAVVPRVRRRINPPVVANADRTNGFELKDFVLSATAGRPAPKEGDCVVCFVEDSTVAIVGCGHLCLCGPCAIPIQRERSCPVCRWKPKDEKSPFAIITIYTGKEKPPPKACSCQSATQCQQSV